MDSEPARYARQILLPGVGEDGQRRLHEASVLVVGVGGLGSPLALYLAAAGIGRLVLVDDDRVDLSNLQRQVLYATTDVGRLKVEAAAERLHALNPDVEVILRAERFTAANARTLVRSADVVADGSDSFATRYLVNDACVLEHRPGVHGAVSRFEGQVTVLHHAGGPCYRCLYPVPPPAYAVPTCAEGGVLGSVVGTVGTLQATEVLKLLLGVGEPLAGRLLVLDALGGTTRTVTFARDNACPVCGSTPTIRDVAEPGVHEACDPWTLSPGAARTLLASDAPPLLLDVRSAAEHDAENIGGQLFPLEALPARVGTFDPSRPVLVYCQRGVRSAHAVRLLRTAGVTAFSLGGGMEAWRTG